MSTNKDKQWISPTERERLKSNLQFVDNMREVSWKTHIIQGAEKFGVSPAKIAIQQDQYPKCGMLEFWSEPLLSSNAEAELPNAISLATDKNMLSDLSWSISNSLQFPVNTIFTHGLGVVASAMSKSFNFEYQQGVKPVNLYVVTAQPPSTGKSGVNDLLSEPVQLAFEAINKTATTARKKAKIRIAATKAELKNAKSKESQFALEDDLQTLYKEHDKHTVYIYSADDATAEGLSKLAASQKGIFNIISAEADAINVILGGVYSDKKSNHGIFLKGWDAERVSIVRASKDNLTFTAIGNIAVIAQDESIKTILEAGESGRGISERFLLMREPTRLGKRNFRNQEKVNPDLLAQYKNMIFNITRESGITLKFSPESSEIINQYREELEPKMGDDGEYSNNMMRGFVGKADKQIMKIACVLHTMENWCDNGGKSPYIENETTESAIRIFKEYVKSYTIAADDLGFTGVESEYKKVEERLQSYAEKGKLVVTISQLRSNIKDVKPFTGTPNLTVKLREVILPVLEKNSVCVVHNNKIYMNPHLKG